MKPRTGTEANVGKTAKSWTGQTTSARDARHTVFHRRVHPGPDSRDAPATGSRTYDERRSSKVQLCDHTDPTSTAGVQTEASMYPAQPVPAASRESSAGERQSQVPCPPIGGLRTGSAHFRRSQWAGSGDTRTEWRRKGGRVAQEPTRRAGRHSRARLERAAFAAMSHASPTLQRDTQFGQCVHAGRIYAIGMGTYRSYLAILQGAACM